MHEVSIVRSIIKTLESEFASAKLAKLKRIYLKVGVLSNIEPRLLYNAYAAYNFPGSLYHNVALEIESTAIIIRCETCNRTTEVKQYRFICATCGKPSKDIIQGEEMLIHKVEFED